MTLPIATNSLFFISAGNDYWDFAGHPLNALAGRDADGHALRFSLAPGGAPDFGRAWVAQDGTFMYRPNGDGTRDDSFIYRITDPTGGTDTATVTVRIRDDAPALLKGTAGNDILLADDGANACTATRGTTTSTATTATTSCTAGRATTSCSPATASTRPMAATATTASGSSSARPSAAPTAAPAPTRSSSCSAARASPPSGSTGTTSSSTAWS